MDQKPGILGPDNRVESPVEQFPYSAVVALVYEGKNEHTTCSASFIASNVLITTASCVYDLADESYYDFKKADLYDAYGNKLKYGIDSVTVTTQYILGVSAATAKLSSGTDKQLERRSVFCAALMFPCGRV
jgi:hypothetical protein